MIRKTFTLLAIATVMMITLGCESGPKMEKHTNTTETTTSEPEIIVE